MSRAENELQRRLLDTIRRHFISSPGTARTEAKGMEAPKDWRRRDNRPNKPLMRMGPQTNEYCPRPFSSCLARFFVPALRNRRAHNLARWLSVSPQFRRLD